MSTEKMNVQGITGTVVNENALAVMGTEGAMTITDELVSSTGKLFSSMPQNTLMEKAAVMNAISNPDFKAADIVNKGSVLLLKNIVMHDVMMVDEKTGEIFEATRCILVTESGKTIAAVSEGVKGSIKRLVQFFGMPQLGGWSEPIPVVIKQQNTRKGNRVYNFEVFTGKLEAKTENVIR
jgi:hypothetical protein